MFHLHHYCDHELMAATAAAITALHIPTVTEVCFAKQLIQRVTNAGSQDDLFTFHARHFQACPTFEQNIAPEDVPDAPEDDGLGYYPDGVKRTLTDEQIVIFRHSEIQTLLRERTREREAAEEAAEDGKNQVDQVDITSAKNIVISAPQSPAQVVEKNTKTRRKRKQKGPNQNRRSKIDGEWTPRRVAREQDTVPEDMGDLDYG